MGDVAFRAASYLVDKLKAQEFAEILPERFFYLTGSVIEGGLLSAPQLPRSKFYFWKNSQTKQDLIIFLSNAQPDLAKAEEYCQRIMYLARLCKVNSVISLAAMPQPVEHTHEPAVWFSGTSKEINQGLKRYNLSHLNEGQVSGMNGLFLGRAKKEGFDGFCLLAEVPLYTINIENPKASYAVLNVLCRMLEIKLDFTELIEQTHRMETEINKLLEYLKIGPQAPGPIGEEEIERIKKSLSQLTKLPSSVKDKIERLFGQVRQDLSQASELKSELDKWNAYKEYEDRFLDLFKKDKGKDN
jgi:proteasome assembly chaperone (PAC2) family protein